MLARLEVILALFGVMAGLALLAQKVKVPYGILLVIGGLFLGWIPGIPRVQLSPELFLLVLLPPLLYPEAVLLPWRDFRANLGPIMLLALGLVLCTMVGVGWIGHWLIPQLPLASAFVLGAIVSPTDPLAATAIAHRMKVPRRIVRVLEGESLVNDATGLVGYHLAVAAVVTGTFSFGQAGLEFVTMTGGGIGVGVAVGWLVAWLQRHIDNPPIEVTLSLLTPFAAYLPAERLGVSGVLAVVAAGLFLGWRSPLIHQAQTRLQVIPVWETIQFLLNGLVFILIGLELPEVIRGIRGSSVAQLAWEAALISGLVIVIRIAWVFAAEYLPLLVSRRGREHQPFPSWRQVAIVAWTGMRGAVSLAAALALPATGQTGEPFAGRNNILFLTYSVILATLVVQGLTLPALIRWLGVSESGEAEEEEMEARLKANQAALARLEELKGKAGEGALEKLRGEYRDRIRQLESFAAEETSGLPKVEGSTYHQLQQEALAVERRTILELRNEHVISDEVMRRIEHDLDLLEKRSAQRR